MKLEKTECHAAGLVEVADAVLHGANMATSQVVVVWDEDDERIH